MAKKDTGPKKTINIIVDKEEKKKALATAMAAIEKQFGAGAVMYMSGERSKLDVEAVSTGSLTLDIALGIGGLPKGRIVEIYGPESGGKTTVALHCVAETQKQGGTAAFIDVEHALDPAYAKKLGVNVDQLLVSQPDSGEQALEIIDALVRSGAIDIIVLDSVAAMTTKAEIEGMMGDATVGMQARLMSSAMRKLTSVVGKTNTIAIFINQIREKIGVVYGNPETTPGGRALKFYSSVRIEVRKGAKIEQGTTIIGATTTARVVKNKVAPPFKTATFDMIFGQGISKVGEIIDIGVSLDIIKKSGSWFSFNDERIGQGREKVKDFLLNNPDIMAEVEKRIRDNADKVELDSSEFGEESESDGAADTNKLVAEATEAAEAAEKEKPVAAAKAAKPGKKSVVIETDDGFEEFSPDEL